jgi:SAM-dependent methyltransferase
MRTWRQSVKRTVRKYIRKALHLGWQRYCPCCKSHIRRFGPYPDPPRPGRVTRADAKCPVCACLERHRLIVRYLAERTDLSNNRNVVMLHVAPEPQMAALFKRAAHLRYVSVDLMSSRAMVKSDLTRLSFGDSIFDVVFCSHVLEHVPDDRTAMKELYRVMRPSGWAILQVPIKGDRTYEDFSITTPEGRLAAFGQHDHVRMYGRDYRDRLMEAGFDVTVDPMARELPERTARRLGLQRDEEIYVCRKAAAETGQQLPSAPLR